MDNLNFRIFIETRKLKYFWSHVTFDKTLTVFIPGTNLADFCATLDPTNFTGGLLLIPGDIDVTRKGDVRLMHFEKICEYLDVDPEYYFPITEDVTY